MEKSCFFNSVNGDRVYNADNLSDYFASFVFNGVFMRPEDGLETIPYNGRYISVKPGRGWISGHLYELTETIQLIVATSPSSGQNRCDRVVLRLNMAARAINLYIKTGTPSSSNPVAPGLQRNAGIYELGIAEIYVPGGSATILQSHITDTRKNSILCGIVTGIEHDIYSTLVDLENHNNNIDSHPYSSPLLAASNIKAAIDQLAIIKADKDTYDYKLNDLQANLTQLINTIVSGSPKGVYATLSALQTAKPAGDTGTYVITADGYWYYWNGSAWTKGVLYQATGVADNSISQKHTTFLPQTANIFNINGPRQTGGYYSQNGVWTANASYDAILVSVKPNTIYTTSFSRRNAIAFFRSNMTFISGVAANTWTAINTPADAAFVSIAIYLPDYWGRAMIIEGAAIPPVFIPFGYTLNEWTLLHDGHWKELQKKVPAEKSLTPDRTTFLAQTLNLINKNGIFINDGYYSSTGVWTVSANWKTIIIKVKANTSYIVNYTTYPTIAFFDENMVFISAIASNAWSGVFSTPDYSYYAAIALGTSWNMNTIMLVEGSSLPASYIPYRQLLDKSIDFSSDAENRIKLKIAMEASIHPEALAMMKQSGNVLNLNGTILPDGYYNSNFNWTANIDYESFIVHVEPNTSYTVNFSGRSHICFLTSTGEYLSGLTANTWNPPINTPPDCYFLTIPFLKTANKYHYMIWKGTAVPAEYIPYEFRFKPFIRLDADTDDIKNDAVTPPKTNFLVQTKNILDPKTERIYGGYYQANGNWYSSESYYTIWIPVKANQKYTPSANWVARSTHCYWDKDKNFISGVQSGTWTEFNTPINTAYLSYPFNVVHTSLEPFMLIEGSDLPDGFIPYGFVFHENLLLNDRMLAGANRRTRGKNMLLFGDSITMTATTSDDGTVYVESARSNWPTFAKSILEIGRFRNYAFSGASFVDHVPTDGNYRRLFSNQITNAINYRDSENNPFPADIIVVALGTNDANLSRQLGSYATAMSKTTLNALDKTLVYEAARYGFWKIRDYWPNAVCYACTPLQKAAYEPKLDYSKAIKEMANRYNFIIIDVENESGIIRDFEVSGADGRFLTDGTHPNVNGQKLQANLISRVIGNTYM